VKDIDATIKQLIGAPIPGAKATLADIRHALSTAAAAVADAQAERDHFRAAFGITQTEMVMLASVLLKRLGKDGKLMVRSTEFEKVSQTHELCVENPEPGVRLYTLRRKGVH
jgi:hypothetical protein